MIRERTRTDPNGIREDETVKTVVIMAMIALSSAAWASETATCGGHIISNGDPKVTVLEHCGEPTDREGDRWVYDRGPEKFLLIIHFDADQVSLIEEVPRD